MGESKRKMGRGEIMKEKRRRWEEQVNILSREGGRKHFEEVKSHYR